MILECGKSGQIREIKLPPAQAFLLFVLRKDENFLWGALCEPFDFPVCEPQSNRKRLLTGGLFEVAKSCGKNVLRTPEPKNGASDKKKRRKQNAFAKKIKPKNEPRCCHH